MMAHLKERLTPKLLPPFLPDLRLRRVKIGDSRNSYLKWETDKVTILSQSQPGMNWGLSVYFHLLMSST